jgi:uncharacterized protein YdeI (YjbR/CyaY-like superfamily)
LKPTHFATVADFRRWLEANHATTKELLLGFYKKASGKGGLTYPAAVDELLCFGWIDGVKRRVDDQRYTHRITPRRPGSIWSLVNVGHAMRLTKAGKMHLAGLAAFKARTKERTGLYSFENRPRGFTADLARIFQAAPTAWTFFSAQPPGYQRTAIFWVSSAKQQATRESRLKKLIALSDAGHRLL